VNLDFKEMPPIFPDQPLWGAKTNSYTFIITKDPDGYSASVKAIDAKPFDNVRHDLGGYAAHQTLEAAKAACEAFLVKKNG
jgi:hypothetical protein